MNKLPQEIIDNIVSFLPDGPDQEQVLGDRRPYRAPYATISNSFCRAVERRSFEHIEITSDDLQAFEQYLSPPRQPGLRALFFSVTLPAIDQTQARRFERPAETEAASQVFSRDVKRLFQVLSSLQCLRGLRLCIMGVAHAPASTKKGVFGAEDEDDLRQYRCLRTRLNLTNANELHRIRGISELSFGVWQRLLAPAVQLDLAARVEGLQVLGMRLDAFEMRYPGFLRDSRKYLADSFNIRSRETSTVFEARIDLSLDGGAAVQTKPMPCLTYPEGYDLLGASLRHWSQRLNNFRAHGVFDESLFWPHAQEDAASTPEWPRLEVFNVHLERHTPSGWWCFMPKGNTAYGTHPRDPATDPNDQPPESYQVVGSEMDVEQDDWDMQDWDMQDIPDAFIDEEEEWNVYNGQYAEDADKCVRNVPNEETMQPLFEAWAKALGNMRSLRQARLCFRIETDLSDSDDEDEKDLCMVDWEVVYEAPDFADIYRLWWGELNDRERSSRRLIFHNTKGWRPDKGTMDILQRVGESSYPGTEMMAFVVDAYDNIIR
ncbi:hypothetical protein KJ359_002618 [Pestalotiopsis sp. 9143b]|nr:hypothetical protein KJ359_002618 [Pestalotiopsis sp. 9143b]